MARLGTWLENQRVLKRMGRLDQTSSVRLQALVDEGKLRWESSPDMNRHSTIFADGGKWMTALDALIRFGEEFGTCDVPSKMEYTLRDGQPFRLGAWLDKQRQKKRTGMLRPEREALLQALVDDGRFRWRVFDSIGGGGTNTRQEDAEWNGMLQALVDHVEAKAFGGPKQRPLDFNIKATCRVGAKDGSGAILQIGKWLNEQRIRRRKGLLPPDKEAKLQELAMRGNLRLEEAEVMSGRDEESWCAHLAALEEHARIYGHCNVPQSRDFPLANGQVVKLGVWLNKQRKDRKTERIARSRFVRLQRLVDRKLLKWNMHEKDVGVEGRAVEDGGGGAGGGGESVLSSTSPTAAPGLNDSEVDSDEDDDDTAACVALRLALSRASRAHKHPGHGDTGEGVVKGPAGGMSLGMGLMLRHAAAAASVCSSMETKTTVGARGSVTPGSGFDVSDCRGDSDDGVEV